ncbi:hypothetical protein R6Q57_013132 [Mikania cordata]
MPPTTKRPVFATVAFFYARRSFPQPLKERLDEGREMRREKEKAFGDRDFLFHRKPRRPRMAYGTSTTSSFGHLARKWHLHLAGLRAAE